MIKEFVLWYLRRHPGLIAEDLRVDWMAVGGPGPKDIGAEVRVRWFTRTVARFQANVDLNGNRNWERVN